MVHSEYLLKVEQTGFPDALGVGCGKKRKVTDDPYFLARATGWLRLTSPERGVAAGQGLVEFGRGKGGHEFRFGHVEFEMSIRHSSGDVKGQFSASEVRKRSLGCRDRCGGFWCVCNV